MSSCFNCLAPRVARRNAKKLAKLQEEDRSKILRTPAPAFALPPPSASLGDYILAKLSVQPDHVGQIDSTIDRQDTYSEIKDRSIRTALWLRSKEVDSGDVVVICSLNHCDTVIPIYATLYCAATIMPWDPFLNTKDIKYLISLSKPKVIFCDENSVCTVSVALQEHGWNSIIVMFGEHPNCISFRDILKSCSLSDVMNFQTTKFDNADQIALIICSSGSTGLPKGVEHTHRSVLIQLGVVAFLNLNGKTSAIFSTLHWVSGIVGTLVILACDMKSIIVPKFEEEMGCRVIEKYKINWVLMGTSVLLRLIYSGHLKKYDISSLEKISGGGGVISSEASRLLNEALPKTMVMLGYGMTELLGPTSVQDPSSKPGSCGKPLMGVACKIVDLQTRAVLGPGQIGEICWQSPCVMKGYHNNPEDTAAAFDEEKWLLSGDIGYYDSDGEIFVVDRLKEMIKYQGDQIAPAELETVIRKHPEVEDCVVVGKPHKIDVEHPVAFVVRKEGSNVTEQEIIDLVASEVIERKRLRGGIRFLAQLPVTPTGKPKRQELKEILKNED